MPKKETALTFFIAALYSTPLESVALPPVATARPVLNCASSVGYFLPPSQLLSSPQLNETKK
jgi:hypothetical protein